MSGPVFFSEDEFGEDYIWRGCEYNECGFPEVSVGGVSSSEAFNEGYGIIEGTFILFQVFQGALLLAFLIVAYAQQYLFFGGKTEVQNEPKVVEFKDRYPIDNAIQSVDCNGAPLRVNDSSFVMEFTPNGIVIMAYSYDDEAFVYWSNKTVSFVNLETVGRKFVTQMCARELYVDRRALMEEKKNKIVEEKKERNERIRMAREDADGENERENAGSGAAADVSEDNKKSSVFASFKSYNTTAGRAAAKMKQAKEGEIEEIDEDEIMKKITVDKSNKYIRRGVVQDFEFAKLPKEDETVDEEKKPILDFSTFKRLFLSSSTSENTKED